MDEQERTEAIEAQRIRMCRVFSRWLSDGAMHQLPRVVKGLGERVGAFWHARASLEKDKKELLCDEYHWAYWAY